MPPKTKTPLKKESNYKSSLVTLTSNASHTIHRHRILEEAIFAPSTKTYYSVTPSADFDSILSAKIEEEQNYLVYTQYEADELEEDIK